MVSWVLFLAAGLLVACGSVKSPEDGPPSDVGLPDVALRLCDSSKPFDSPTMISFGGGDKGEVWLTEDELTAYVTVFGSTYTIFSAARPSLEAPFGSLNPTEVNPGTADGHRGTVTVDSLTMILYSYRAPSLGSQDLFIATRPNSSANFGIPNPVANVNSTAFDVEPMLSSDGLTLYFASNRPDENGPYQVFHTMRSQGGSFGTPSLVGLAGEASGPVLSRDGLTIYFSSERAGGGTGKRNIWVAKRSTLNDGFGAPVAVSELNNTEMNVSSTPNWISSDGCRLYLSRFTSGVGSRVFVASRPERRR